MKTKQILTIMLTLVLPLALLPTAALADGTGKAIQLVTSGAAANIAGAQASNIYFGTYQQSAKDGGGYNTEPIKWRVLQNADGAGYIVNDSHNHI